MSATRHDDAVVAVAESPAPDEPAHALPEGTSATWELEMLISGAVFFALLQLPGVLNGVFAQIEPRLAGGPTFALFLAYWYATAIVYALIAAFFVHLVARAYWVGLVGLRSVYPHGVRWDGLRQGPRARRLYQRRFASLDTVTARVDDFASVIFSFAFVVVFLFLYSTVLSAVLGAVAFGLDVALFGGGHGLLVFDILLALLLLPTSIAATIDRKAGHRIPDGSLAGRAIELVLATGYRIQMLGLYGPVMMTLFSNVRRRIIYPLFYAVFVGVMGASMVQFLARLDLLRAGGTRYLPDATELHGVDAGFYESQRVADHDYGRAPFIQSDIIRDPYIKLFIPYSAERHDVLLAATCPAARGPERHAVVVGRAESDSASERRAAAALACLAAFHQVTLDGRALAGLEFRFHTIPESGVRGIIAYIPTDGLARGQHELRVRAVPAARATPAEARAVTPWIIPFWL
jgi:hypothetical protein